MRIAIDAMGGDNAPYEIVKGAVQAASRYGVEITLVGDQDAIKRVTPRTGRTSLIEIVHASQVIGMDEPVDTFRKRRDSSLVRCAEMVRYGEAQGMFSAGNTGVAMAVATVKLGRGDGIDRPGIGLRLPGGTLLVDAGANADCKLDNIMQFAVMGNIYAQRVLGISRPRVALLGIGAEESDESQLTKAVHAALQQTDLNFIGIG